MSDLIQDLLKVKTPPAQERAAQAPIQTRRLESKGDALEVEVKDAPGAATEGEARSFLEAQGLDPELFAVAGLRASRWTMPNGELGDSVRFQFTRIAPEGKLRVPVEDLISAVELTPAVPSKRPAGDAGFIVAIGDMQFGKIDGDGVEGTLKRTVAYLDEAAKRLDWYRQRWNIGHIHISWLGDHIEGFESQGGANVWRTQLTLSEQIRLTRRVMLYAAERFAPLAERVTMAAIPGNHGETKRFGGKGITRYDDSHDTESLVAVADALALAPDKFGHVECYTPDEDEMTVVLDVAGTTVGMVHGHQFRPGKHFDWWEGQAFGGQVDLQFVDLLLAGHLHHFFVEESGERTFCQVPALESESTWFRHNKGVPGNPGLVVAVTQDGKTPVLEVVR